MTLKAKVSLRAKRSNLLVENAFLCMRLLHSVRNDIKKVLPINERLHDPFFSKLTLKGCLPFDYIMGIQLQPSLDQVHLEYFLRIKVHGHGLDLKSLKLDFKR